MSKIYTLFLTSLLLVLSGCKSQHDRLLEHLNYEAAQYTKKHLPINLGDGVLYTKVEVKNGMVYYHYSVTDPEFTSDDIDSCRKYPSRLKSYAITALRQSSYDLLNAAEELDIPIVIVYTYNKTAPIEVKITKSDIVNHPPKYPIDELVEEIQSELPYELEKGILLEKVANEKGHFTEYFSFNVPNWSEDYKKGLVKAFKIDTIEAKKISLSFAECLPKAFDYADLVGKNVIIHVNIFGEYNFVCEATSKEFKEYLKNKEAK